MISIITVLRGELTWSAQRACRSSVEPEFFDHRVEHDRCIDDIHVTRDLLAGEIRALHEVAGGSALARATET